MLCHVNVILDMACFGKTLVAEYILSLLEDLYGLCIGYIRSLENFNNNNISEMCFIIVVHIQM